MPLAGAAGAICVQRLDDSRNSAIHITYRISLRSSSVWEPRYPLLRVVCVYNFWRSKCTRFRAGRGRFGPTLGPPKKGGEKCAHHPQADDLGRLPSR